MVNPTKEDIDALIAQARHEEIRSLYAVAMLKGPVPSHILFGQGVASLMLGLLPDAIPALEAAAGDPAYAFWGHHWLGLAYRAGQALPTAFREFEKAEQAGGTPDNIELMVDTGLTFLGAPDADPAERATLAARLSQFWKENAPRRPAPISGGDAFAVRLDESEHLLRRLEERQRDAEIVEGRRNGWPSAYRLATDHPVAINSDDHLQPRGTMNDNSRSPRFVAACERQFGRSLQALDLGCAGGGLVRDFLISGHRAFGLEGSDASKLAQRAEWRLIPDHLQTCDITKQFTIYDSGEEIAQFDVISAWEVLEHLPAETLPLLFANIARHLAPGGLFIGSVAQFEDRDPVTGAVWHVTLKAREWWCDMIRSAGMEPMASPFRLRDHVRGSGNGPHDWDAGLQPELGFHIAAAVGGGGQ
jgi:SAM-dependent methyltransferase